MLIISQTPPEQPSISEDDIRLLIRHNDPDVRANAATRICRQVRTSQLSDIDRQFAIELLEFMAHDTVSMVRRALAVTLKNSPELPREIALKLASDIDNIAVPILTHSPVFTDEDLVEILKSKAAAKISAVARRETLSDVVVRAIIRFGDSKAVAAVAANDGALISEETAKDVLRSYHDNDLIKQGFIDRRDLPPGIAERLVTMVSEEVAVRLHRRHKLPPKLAVKLAVKTRERASLDLIDQGWVSKDYKGFVKTIHEEGRLTSTLILRSAGRGQIRFVEHALARLSGVNYSKSALMIHDGGPFGLKALCARAGLNAVDTHIIRAACAIFRDLEINMGFNSPQEFQKKMIERVLSLPLELPQSEQDYLMDCLDGLDQMAA